MNKKYSHGLVIGKFYPFHKGHQFLVERALEESDKVSVIVCHQDYYLIDGNVRAGWIKELYPEAKVSVFVHGKELDSSSTDISPLWAKITIDFLGEAPDAVFSSEPYGEPYARCMGASHVLVDMDRNKVPISGTLVRSDPYKYWDFISEPVREFYAKRVVVLGAESTGTTTLARDLAEYYKTCWVPEYGRIYSEGKLESSNNAWITEEFVHIANIQNSMENALARKCNKLLVCDTDAFATRLWHERYMGTLSDEVEKCVNIRNKDLYILTGDEIPFVQDGTRDGENIRHKMHKRFVDDLKKYKLNHIVVRGNEKERLKISVSAIDKLFGVASRPKR